MKPDINAIKAKHLQVIQEEKFPYSLDQQQRVVEYLQSCMQAGGPDFLNDPIAKEVLVAMAERIGQSPERVMAIAHLKVTAEVRRALKAQPMSPRPRKLHEAVYPKTGWLGAYLDFSILSEQPLGWHFWSGMAVLGAACRRNLYIDLGFGDVLYPNTYVLLVGDSGLGKNQAINRAVRVMKRANDHNALITECLARGKDLRVEVLNEVTAESLVMALQPGPTAIPGTGILIERAESIGLLVNPETANLLGKGRKELSDRLIGYLTDMYDGDPKASLTVTRGARNLGPSALTLILGSTVEWIGSSVTTAIVSGGFTGRCTFVHRTERDRVKYREIPTDYVPDPVLENELARMLVPWMTAHPLEAVMEPEAQGWWEEWYVKHREAECPSPTLEGWWARKPVHLAKIAMLLTASELCSSVLDLKPHRSVPISLAMMQKALKLLDLEQERIPKVLEHIERAPELPLQEYVKGHLRKLLAKSDPVLHKDLFFRCRWRVGTPQRFRAVMNALVDSGEVLRSMAPSRPGDDRTSAYTMDTTAEERRLAAAKRVGLPGEDGNV